MERTRKFPKPKTKGVASVPVVMQLEALECGAASLTMIMHYYRYWIPLEQVRGDCGVSRDGASAKNILLAARGYGLSANAWKMEPEALQKEGPFPCILHWGFNHFVVLCGFRGGKAVVNDPARGRIFVSMEEFDKCFTGVVLTWNALRAPPPPSPFSSSQPPSPRCSAPSAPSSGAFSSTGFFAEKVPPGLAPSLPR